MRTQKRINKAVIMAVLVVVTGCSSEFRDVLGMRRNAPDEFRVVSNAPLSVPPEFTLRPPMPGARRPQDSGLDEQAKNILFENQSQSSASGISAGESVFLQKANVSNAESDIKNILNQEEIDKVKVEDKKGFWEKFAEFTHLKSKEDPSVNAAKEKARILENKKEGRPVNEGEVPVVKETGWQKLKNIFN